MLVQLIEAAAALHQGQQAAQAPPVRAQGRAVAVHHQAAAEPRPTVQPVIVVMVIRDPPEAAAGQTLDMEADKNGRAS